MALKLNPIPGAMGYSILGEVDGKFGPVRMFYRSEPTIDIPAVTVDTTGSSSDLVFTGLNPTTKFKPGDYGLVTSGLNKYVFRAGVIDSDSIQMRHPEKDEPLLLDITGVATIRKWEIIDMGETDDKGVKIKFSEKTAANKQAGYGDSESNHWASGLDASVEANMNENTLERFEALFPGLLTMKKDVNGNIIAAAIGTRLGFNYKSNARMLSIVALKDGALSDDPRDRFDLFKVTFKPEIEFERGSGGVANLKLTGMAYQDKTRLVNGRPAIGALATESFTFDV